MSKYKKSVKKNQKKKKFGGATSVKVKVEKMRTRIEKELTYLSELPKIYNLSLQNSSPILPNIIHFIYKDTIGDIQISIILGHDYPSIEPIFKFENIDRIPLIKPWNPTIKLCDLFKTELDYFFKDVSDARMVAFHRFWENERDELRLVPPFKIITTPTSSLMDRMKQTFKKYESDKIKMLKTLFGTAVPVEVKICEGEKLATSIIFYIPHNLEIFCNKLHERKVFPDIGKEQLQEHILQNICLIQHKDPYISIIHALFGDYTKDSLFGKNMTCNENIDITDPNVLQTYTEYLNECGYPLCCPLMSSLR